MPSFSLPRVHITQLLKESLEADGYDADDYCTYFAQWKASAEAGEYADWFFGKDGFYDRPKRNNQHVLRHVHLPPAASSEKLAIWDRDFKNGARKVSDTALIYVQDAAHGYLLIYIVREPNGHLLVNMKTKESKKLMENLCDIAQAFIFNGDVLV